MSQTPYSAPSDQHTPPQDNTLKIVLIVIGVILLLVMLVCGGIMAAGYFAVQRVATEVQGQMDNVFSGKFAEEYLQSPEAEEALGDVVSTEFITRANEEENANLEIRVKGTKGAGTLIIGSDDEGEQLIQLVMDDGRIIELPPPDYAADEDSVDELELEMSDVEVAPEGN